MRTYKSFERPSQIQGIDINNLFVVFGFLVGSGLFIGFLGMFLDIPWVLYLLVVLVTLGLFFLFKYLSKHRPPGFVQGFISFHLRQPKRLHIAAYRPQKNVRTRKK